MKRRQWERWGLAGQPWEWKLDAAPLALLAALTVLYFRDWIFLGRLPFGDDVSQLSIPLYVWLHRKLAAGLPTAWTQNALCGGPVFDHLLTPDFYLPRRLLLTWCGPFRAYVIDHAGHFLWGAWGVYALCRFHRRSPVAALLAAVATAFGGGFFYGLRWFSVLTSIAWMPWIMLGLAWIRCGDPALRWRGAGLTGLALGNCFSGGYPGTGFYIVAVLAFLEAAWLLRGAGVRRRLAWMAAPAAAAALLFVAQYLGILHGVERMSSQSLRGAGLDLARAAVGSLSPVSLLQAFTPYLLGHVRDNSFLGMAWKFGSAIPQGMLLYVGIPGLLLAVRGLGAGWRRHWPLLAALAGIVVYALGDWTPLYAWIIKLPVFSHLRAPSKIMMLAGLLLCLPLAEAWDGLDSSSSRRLGGWALLLAGLMLAAALGLAVLDGRIQAATRSFVVNKVAHHPFHQYPPDYYVQKLARLMVVARGHLAAQGAFALATGLLLLRWAPGRRGTAVGLLLAAALFAELSSNGSHYLPETDPAYYTTTPDSIRWMRRDRGADADPWRVMTWGWGEELRRVYPEGYAEAPLEQHLAFKNFSDPSDGLMHGYDLFNGYSAAELRRHGPLHGWFQDAMPGVSLDDQTRELLRRRRLWDLGGVAYVLSSRPLDAEGLVPARPGRPYLYRNLQAAPLAYLARTVQGGWTQDGAVAALCAPGALRRYGTRPALVEGAGPFGSAGGDVRWVDYQDHHWELAVDCRGGSGTLVLSRIYYAGLWTAFVDGKPAAMLPVNGAYVAVEVPEGPHRVELRERPAAPAWTRLAWAAASLAALALILL